MQFVWSQSIIHFSLITVTEYPPKYLSRKHFCSYYRHKEASRQQKSWVSVLCSAPICSHGTPWRLRSASSGGCAAIGTHSIHTMFFWTGNSGRLGQIHSLRMSSKAELQPGRPAASPLAPAGVNHASVEPDSSGEITL